MAVAMKKAKRVEPAKGTMAYEYKHLDIEPLMLQFIMLLDSSGKEVGYVSQKTGIATDTIRRWRLRKTRRPNASTLRFAYRALGYKLGPIKE